MLDEAAPRVALDGRGLVHDGRALLGVHQALVAVLLGQALHVGEALGRVGHALVVLGRERGAVGLGGQCAEVHRVGGHVVQALTAGTVAVDAQPRLRTHGTRLAGVEVGALHHRVHRACQALHLAALDARAVPAGVDDLDVGAVAEVGQLRGGGRACLGLDQGLDIRRHATLVAEVEVLGRQDHALLGRELELGPDALLGLLEHLHVVGAAVALGVHDGLVQLADLGLQLGIERGVVDEGVLATGLARHGDAGQRGEHLAVRGPCHLFALGAELVAVDGVAIEVVNGPEHLVGVQACLRVDGVEEVVGVTALVDVHVAVAVDVLEHLPARGVVAFALAVVGHVDGQGAELLLRLHGQLAVCRLHQLVVVLCAGALDEVGVLLGVRIEDRALVLGVVLCGQLEGATDGRLLGQRGLGDLG